MRTTILVSILGVTLALSACDNGGSGSPSTTQDATSTPDGSNNNQGCNSDFDCPSGYECVAAGKADQATDACVAGCLGECDPFDLPPGFASCDDLCGTVCDPAQCQTTCLADCNDFGPPPGYDSCDGFCDETCSGSNPGIPDEGSFPDAGGTPDAGGNPQPQPTSGVCREKEPEPQPTPVTWAGTWAADLQYTASCDLGFGNVKKADQSHTVTVKIAGPNDSLTATPGVNHEMTGFGSDTQLTLNGTFPVLTDSGKEASIVQKDTKITIKLTDVASDKSASGTISGTYTGSGFSGDCTVVDGTIQFTR